MTPTFRRSASFWATVCAAWALVGGGTYLLAGKRGDQAASEVPEIRVVGVRKLASIAVPDFKDLSPLPDTSESATRLATILRSDLAISGFFKVIPPETYLVAPADEGITAATVRFRDWFRTGAQLLVKVGAFVTGDRLRLEAHLYEVGGGRSAWTTPLVFKGDLSDGRMMAHRLANAIIKHFTGEEGLFTTRIAYAKASRVKDELAKNLHVIGYDGQDRRVLTRNSALNLFPRFSPSGAHIVYSTTVNARWEIVRHSFATGRNKTLTSFPGLALGAAYSPNGQSIAVSMSKDGNAEIYELDRGGKVLRRLTKNWSIDTSPTWSPDGSRIAFVSDRSGTPQVYVMRANGDHPKRLTFRGNYNQEPDWSPKGKELVFTARDERAKFDLFLVDVDDGLNVKRLTQDEGQNESGRFGPDGRQIVFSSTRSGAYQLFFMQTDTRETRPVPNAGRGVYTPAWSPRAR
jgi:TolB protein